VKNALLAATLGLSAICIVLFALKIHILGFALFSIGFTLIQVFYLSSLFKVIRKKLGEKHRLLFYLKYIGAVTVVVYLGFFVDYLIRIEISKLPVKATMNLLWRITVIIILFIVLTLMYSVYKWFKSTRGEVDKKALALAAILATLVFLWRVETLITIRGPFCLILGPFVIVFLTLIVFFATILAVSMPKGLVQEVLASYMPLIAVLAVLLSCTPRQEMLFAPSPFSIIIWRSLIVIISLIATTFLHSRYCAIMAKK